MLARREVRAMSGDDPGDVVDFDAEAVLSAARDAVGDEAVYVCVVYDAADFRTVYVDDRVDELYDDADERADHFGQIHSYVHLDFTEQQLFNELFRQPDGVRAFVTYLDSLVAVRVVSGGQGVFLSVAPDAPVTDLVNAVERERRR
jgi:hypothetical protein